VLDTSARELQLRSVSDRPVVITGDLQLPPAGIDVERVTLEGLQFSGRVTLTHGVLALQRVVANEVQVTTQFFAPEQPVLDAADSLIGTLRVPDGYARLERCTVRRDAVCGAVLARNSVFNAALADAHDKKPAAGEIRYCRIPAALAGLADPPGGSVLFVDTTCTTDAAVLFASPADDPVQRITPDAAVLSPDCPDSILFGADDGGELGVYHDGRAGRPVALGQPQHLALTREHDYVLRDLVFAAAVGVPSGARQPLVVERVAISDLLVQSNPRTDDAGRPAPVLDARSSLFGTLGVKNGLARLEYCTVLADAVFAAVQASDCIFAGKLTAGGLGGEPRPDDCLRYSRIPPKVLAGASAGGVRLPFCTDAAPVFFTGDFARAVGGAPGGGVLHPATPAAVGSGAEDGGELGAYHQRRYVLSAAAVGDKLADHLPVGLEPVLIPDIRLQAAPMAARVA
jgi:hypothetical protein